MEMLELVENIRVEEASVMKLFGSEGKGVRSAKKNATYLQKLAEAARLVADVVDGRRHPHILSEAMTTSDFPNLFGDILDRQLLAAYRAWPNTWPNYCKRARVRDFRTVKRFSVYGADQVLPNIPSEKGEYKREGMFENSPFSYAVKKYGRILDFSWETLINDDLDAFADIPERFGIAAGRTEEKFVTELFVDSTGPHGSFYTGGNANIVTGNPVLSIAGLQTAMTVLGNQLDEQSEPIVIDTVELVVPPALEIVALNILNAIQLELTEGGGTSNQKLITSNWMKTRVRLSVNPYLSIVASSSNGATQWYLFANPSNGRPALEAGFLRGHEEPEVFIKSPNARKVGGGDDAFNGDFNTDNIEYKVRHVLGGARMDPKMTVASDGSGS